ncbi:MAG: hypothetical protein IPL91_14530 [Hyphomicrobium sp.]|nr:hypothetical protein [Hyphomicrobium sp.]
MSTAASVRLADKYIGRDGSRVSANPTRAITRAAVKAAQQALCESLGVSQSPVADKDMHKAILAASRVAPDVFGDDAE